MGADDALCALCGEKAAERWLVCSCGARTHVECLAQHFLQARHPALGSGPGTEAWLFTNPAVHQNLAAAKWLGDVGCSRVGTLYCGWLA